jgi:hypothetical protein
MVLLPTLPWATFWGGQFLYYLQLLLEMLNTWKAVAIVFLLVVVLNSLILFGYIQRAGGAYTSLMRDYTTFIFIAALVLVAVNILVSIFTLLSARRSARLIESPTGYSLELQQRSVAEQYTGLPQDLHDVQRDPLLAKLDPVVQEKIREFQQEIAQARQDEESQQEREAPLQQRIYELEQEVVHLQQEQRHLAEELKKVLLTRHEAEQERERIIEGLESLQQVLQKRNSPPT